MWQSLSRLPVCAERNAHFDGHNGSVQTISIHRHFLTRGHYSLYHNHQAIHCAFQSVLLEMSFVFCSIWGTDLFVYRKQ